jgi:glycosyltransferase involved in cell wall biosynthesis
MLESLGRHYGPPRRGRVVFNGRDAARFAPAAKQPLVFAAGRLWDEAKNLAALDRAAAGLEWPVYVAGDTRHPTGGQARFRRARALGRLDASGVASWMARASIYALPARYEPFGLSILEAALSGCALVLGDLPSLRELWEDAAVWVPPGDDRTLAGALDSLIRDARLRRSMAARARARAERYTPEAMVRGYLALYAELLAGKEAAPAVC